MEKLLHFGNPRVWTLSISKKLLRKRYKVKYSKSFADTSHIGHSLERQKLLCLPFIDLLSSLWLWKTTLSENEHIMFNGWRVRKGLFHFPDYSRLRGRGLPKHLSFRNVNPMCVKRIWFSFWLMTMKLASMTHDLCPSTWLFLRAYQI